MKQANWLELDPILSYFESARNSPDLNRFLSYQEFVEGHDQDPKAVLGRFTLD